MQEHGCQCGCPGYQQTGCCHTAYTEPCPDAEIALMEGGRKGRGRRADLAASVNLDVNARFGRLVEGLAQQRGLLWL